MRPLFRIDWLTLLVFGFAGRRSDLGAEPGFEGDSPQGGQTSVIMLRRSSDHPFKVLEKQPENDLTQAQGQTQSLGVFVEGPAQALLRSGPVRLFVRWLLTPLPAEKSEVTSPFSNPRSDSGAVAACAESASANEMARVQQECSFIRMVSLRGNFRP